MNGSGACLLLVGGRTPPAEAALRRGLPCHVLAEAAPARALRGRLAGWAVVDFDAPPAELRAAAAAALGGARPDRVVAVTERAVPVAAGLRVAYGAPGLDPEIARAAHYKPAMKARLQAAGLPCRATHVVASLEEARAVAEALGYPVVAKALSSSGSRGTVVVRAPAELDDAVGALLGAARAGGVGLEQFIAGTELSVESFVQAGRAGAVNLTEYVIPGRANLVPAPLDVTARAELLVLNQQVLAAFGIQDGLTHVELYRSPEGLVVGEIAVRPPGGHVMELIGLVHGVEAWDLWLRAALGEPVPPLPPPQGAAGNLFFHPGAGVVASVDGWEAVRALEGVVEARLRLEVGDTVAAREGTGQSVGEIVARGPTPESVRETLLAAEQALSVRMAAPAAG